MNILIIIIAIVIIFFFCLIFYDDSDNYILENGRKTKGIITSVQSRSQTDQYGKVHVSYIVSYQFSDLEERTWRGKFNIHSSVCRFKEEDKIEVYYLPNKPYKNAVSKFHKLR